MPEPKVVDVEYLDRLAKAVDDGEPLYDWFPEGKWCKLCSADQGSGDPHKDRCPGQFIDRIVEDWPTISAALRQPALAYEEQPFTTERHIKCATCNEWLKIVAPGRLQPVVEHFPGGFGHKITWAELTF